MTEIKPRCVLGITEPYISSEGYFYPCCWIANENHLSDLKRYLGRRYEQLDLNRYTMEEVSGSAAMRAIRASWPDKSFYPCEKYCTRPLEKQSRNKPDRHWSLKNEES